MDAAVRQPDGSCTVRVRTNARGGSGEPLYVTVVFRDGETVRSDDPTVTQALNALRGGGAKVLNTLGVRPPTPTHDMDTKPRAPLLPGNGGRQ